MRTAVLITLIGAVAAPSAAQDRTVRTVRVDVVEHRLAHDSEREYQQTQQQREQAERERQRAQEQAERDRERAQQQAERDRERALEQAERDRERAREQAERDRERAQLQAERARQQAERDRERGRSQRGNRVEEVERTTRTFRIGSSGELHLANVAGDIVITRGSGNEAHVEIVKTGYGLTADEAREMLKLVEIDVVERPNRAEIRTRYPERPEMQRGRRNFSVSVAFTVTVPAATRIRANSISGSLSARDVRGDLVLKTVSGTVRLVNGGGSGSAESISGNVEVTDTAFEGPWSASSASGSMVLKRVKARRLTVNSISGNVMLDDVECPAVDAGSVSGNIQFSGALPRSSRYELSSHSGNVNVAIGAGSGFEVEATSFSGSVRSDFQFTSRDQDGGRGRFNRTLRGVVGDGSAVFDLSTFSGSIFITKR